MEYKIHLPANTKVKQQTSGKFFLLMSTGVATTISVSLMNGTHPVEEISDGARGLKMRASHPFGHVELLSTVDADCTIVISEGEVDIDLFSGSTVNANILQNPLPVQNDRGTPGNLMYVSAVTVNDTPATSVTNGAPVAVTSAGAVVAAASATRRELRLLNIGPDPVSIGPAGSTWAQRVVVLQAGDVWIETRGANLAWSGITDVGFAASVGVQGVLA